MVRKNAVRLWAVVFWLVVWQLGSMAFGQTLLLPSRKAQSRLFQPVTHLIPERRSF